MRQTSPVTITVYSGGKRLDAELAGHEQIKSRMQAKRLIEAGHVKVNGKVAKKTSTELRSEDRLDVTLFDDAPIPVDASSTTPLSVLYEDDHCMVISKPAGLVVHPAANMSTAQPTVLSELKPLFAARRLPFSESEALVHRLDKDTTGCLLIAKNPKAHAALQKQFADRTVSKTYLALVYGRPSHATAVIDAPIGRHSGERTKMSVHRASAAREAKTTYRTVSSVNGVSLLECDLHTGRTHQIRVHLSAIGHPVLGDATYKNPQSEEKSEELGISSLCLHSWKLEFDSGKKRVSVKCPEPESLKRLIKTIGL